jgi:hypothetical protein
MELTGIIGKVLYKDEMKRNEWLEQSGTQQQQLIRDRTLP